MDNNSAKIEPSASALEKLNQLKQILREMDSLLVAYSGGVDSTFLLRVALDVLNERVLAVTARSPFRPQAEVSTAADLARELNAHHLWVDSDELADPVLANNPRERCYHCKRRVFGSLLGLARDRGLRHVVDGTNHDDLGEYRPGLRALQELGVRSPLAEVGLTKDEIRALSSMLGLSNWDRPSQSCLATRFPYGEQLTPAKLNRAEEAEKYLHSLGFTELRVRSHGSLARIEVSPNKLPDLVKQATGVVDKLQDLGFAYVTMDLRGYRTGSMDEQHKSEGQR